MIILTFIIFLFCLISVLIPVYYEKKMTYTPGYGDGDGDGDGYGDGDSDGDEEKKSVKISLPLHSKNNVTFKSNKIELDNVGSYDTKKKKWANSQLTQSDKSKDITISYGTYYDNASQKKFSRLSNIENDLKYDENSSYPPVAQIDKPSEINNILLPDQVDVIKETVTIQNSKDYDKTKVWKNVYLSNGFKLNKYNTMSYNYYSKNSEKELTKLKEIEDKSGSSEINIALKQILCCISFNFQIMPNVGDKIEAIDTENKCISFEKINNKPITTFLEDFNSNKKKHLVDIHSIYVRFNNYKYTNDIITTTILNVGYINDDFSIIESKPEKTELCITQFDNDPNTYYFYNNENKYLQYDETNNTFSFSYDDPIYDTKTNTVLSNDNIKFILQKHESLENKYYIKHIKTKRYITIVDNGIKGIEEFDKTYRTVFYFTNFPTDDILDLVNPEFSVDYSFKHCNTHDNKQKFIVSRYSYKYDEKKNKEQYIPDDKGLYVSIKHRSLYNGYYYLIWNDSVKKPGKQFKLKKFTQSEYNNHDHILWLFYPEVNITKASIPSQTWCNYNTWLKGPDLSDLMDDLEDMTTSHELIHDHNKGSQPLPENEEDKNTPKKPPPKDLLQADAEMLGPVGELAYQAVDETLTVAAAGAKFVANKVANAAKTGVNTAYDTGRKMVDAGKAVVDAIDLLAGDNDVYVNLKTRVRENDTMVAEEYKTKSIVFAPVNFTAKNNKILKEYGYNKNTNTFGDESYNRLLDIKEAHVYSSNIYLPEQTITENLTLQFEYDGCQGTVNFYPEYVYKALNSGKVGDVGFTATTMGDKFDKNDDLTLINKSIVDKDNIIVSDGDIKWVRSDPYTDTITFSSDYFYGIDTSNSISTTNGLSFEKVITSPFYPDMTETTIMDFIRSEDGVGSITPDSEQTLNGTCLSYGHVTFSGDEFIKSEKGDKGGKGIEININKGLDFIKDYSVQYPGTSYEIAEGISIHINGTNTDITDDKQVIKFKVGTSFGRLIEPEFKVIEIDEGSELFLKYDGVSLFKKEAIDYLTLKPQMEGTCWIDDLGLEIINGGYGFNKTKSKILIKATNPADSRKTAGLLFKVTHTDVNTYHMIDHIHEDNNLNTFKNLYSGVSLFSSDSTRIPTYTSTTNYVVYSSFTIKKYDIEKLKYNIVFDLRDSNEILRENPMVSPSQIGYAGTPLTISKNKYNTRKDIKILRDLFTNLDSGNSKKTLSSIFNIKREEKIVDLNNNESQFYKPNVGKQTTTKTNTSINFLRTLQLPKLNYGNNSYSGIDDTLDPIKDDITADGDKLILSNWIPYKEMVIYYDVIDKHNPGPGIYAPVNNGNPIRFYNFNSAQIIPYGIDHMYDRFIDPKSIPTF